jgi:hypothetical protein
MPRGEDVEIAEPADLVLFLVAPFLVVLRVLTFLLFLLFFTRHPSSFENPNAANRRQSTNYPIRWRLDGKRK